MVVVADRWTRHRVLIQQYLAVVVADRWMRHHYHLSASRIPLHSLLQVAIAVLPCLEVPSRRLDLRRDAELRLSPPLELVHLLVLQAVAPVLPSLLLLGVVPAFFCLFPAGALVLLPAHPLPAGALVLLPAHPLPAGALVLLPVHPLPAVLLDLLVAALLPEDFLAVPGAAAVPPLLVAGPV